MATDETYPSTCMADGCDAPLDVGGFRHIPLTTDATGGKICDERAPRRQVAKCQGEDHHEFQRYEGFDWTSH